MYVVNCFPSRLISYHCYPFKHRILNMYKKMSSMTPQWPKNIILNIISTKETYCLRYFLSIILNAIDSDILMILSHTINSKNIFVKKREREKTVNTGAECQAAYTASDIF